MKRRSDHEGVDREVSLFYGKGTGNGVLKRSKKDAVIQSGKVSSYHLLLF